MARHYARISLTALIASLTASAAFAQAALPTITITHTHPIKHTHGGAPHAHPPVTHTHVIRAPAPVAVRPPAPAPVVVAAPAQPPITSSSEKYFTGQQVNARPIARPGEALEIVPGLIVTQHSGEGKANQYFLRGFNLDHGSDMAVYLDGMPLNMRTHGHGQGWIDANFLMPELMSSVTARKGPYSAEDGDFSNAGSIYLQYLDKVDKGYFLASGGSFGHGRLFGVKSWDAYGGSILGAAEASIYNGPWERPDSVRKINGVLRFSRGTQEDGLAVTAMAYANRWYSTDQLPDRAVYTGLMSKWGSLNTTDGGDTTRFSLSARWSQKSADNYSRVEAYAMRSTLELYNDFTYFMGGHFLGDYDLGDQFRQSDKRTMIGVNALHGINWAVASLPVETRFGFQGRFDDIRVGLFDTYRRTAYDTVRDDRVAEGSVGVWTDTTVKWTPWLRTMGGVRLDYFHADVTNNQSLAAAPKVLDGAGNPAFLWAGPFNQGSKGAALVSPKAGIVVGPFYKTEAFFNYGEGFHSTDARGTVQNWSTTEVGGEGMLDVGGLSRVGRIPLLVKSRSAEIGARTKFIDGLDTSISFFWLNSESENQYAGDSGTTEFGRPSRRYGIELSNHYQPVSWMRFDGDLALVNARYRGVDQLQTLAWLDLITPEALPYGTFRGNAPGNHLANTGSIIASAAVDLGEKTGWFGGLKYRYFGPRALTEDGYFKSPATGTVNGRVGYRWEDGWKVQLDVFNLFNSRSDAITYGYGSMLRTDPLYGQCLAGTAPGPVCGTGVMGRHFKPMEPVALRLTIGGPLPF